MKKRIFPILSLLIAASSPLAQGTRVQGAATAADWSYQGDLGPAYWGSLSPAFARCAKGRQQSPVDIRDVRPAELPRLSFSFRSSSLAIRSGPNTLALDFEPDSYLYIGKRRYVLFRIEFHTPGEHLFNGRASPMEIHFKYADANGERLVVAVPVAVGRRINSMLRRIGDYLPEPGVPAVYENHVGVNATFLLPPRRDYFTYTGSMSEPPCGEGVRWVVMKEPVTISAAYLARFRRLIGTNARPVQPLNGRQIQGTAS
jgi:carbonic anhydrase